MSHRLILLSFLALLASVPSSAVAQERQPVRLFAEGEDFVSKSPGWSVVPFRENYYAATFAITFLSRMACLGAPEQVPTDKPAVAELAIEVPYADTYELLARYEQPLDFAAEFTVEVVQNGAVVATLPCGRLTDPKIWAFTNHQRLPMVRYTWSGTDNIVWQNPGSVKLAAGPATLRLIAAAQMDGDKPRANAARRHVDVLCLTNDRAGMEAQKKTRYLEYDGWLVQDGDLFIRVTNPADAAGPVVPVIAPFDQGQHSPYYIHIRDWPTTTVLKSGRVTTPTTYSIHGPRSSAVRPDHIAPALDPTKFATIPAEEHLKPGESSGWVPLGDKLDTLNNSQWYPQVKGATEVYLRLEFAVPDGSGGLKVIKDVTVRGPAGNFSPAAFELPGCVHPNPALSAVLAERFWPPVIRTQKEALTWLTSEVKKFPDRGPTPKRLLHYNILGFGSGLATFPEARELALELGDNTAVGQEGKKRQLVAHLPDPNPDAIKKLEASRKDGFQDVQIVSYGDEIHLPAVPLTDDEFKSWLDAKGVKYDGPIEFVRAKPGMSAADREAQRKHPFYYYSQAAAKEKGGARYAAGTAYYKSLGVLTGANYSPHANFLVTEIDYIRPFKLKAMSMPWAEDYAWQIAEFSPQVFGYLASGLRAGAKYDNLPMHLYVMPHSPGQTADEFRLMYYTAVGHGAKMINYFCASPSAVGNTENYVDTNDLAMWKVIHDCTHEAGVFEDYVMDGNVRPARVGMLLSSVDELVTGVNNFSLALHNNERKAVYYALKHAGVPVDFLSEDDVIEGRAKGYDLIYVTQEYLHSKCVDALSRWVSEGGTLVALCGGGMKDEFQRTNPATASLFGATGPEIQTDPNLVSQYLRTENSPFFSKHDLPRYQPIDMVSLTDATVGTKVPVIAWKQPLTVTDGTILAKFRDGTAAAVSKPHGKGKAVLFGFLPGQAYLKSGMPLRPVDRGATNASFSHFLPTEMDTTLRAVFVDTFLPADSAGLRPAIVSQPLVEATVIDTPAVAGRPARTAVTLLNFSGKPTKSATVTVRGIGAATTVRSVIHGPVPSTRNGNDLVVTFPITVADMLLIDR